MRNPVSAKEDSSRYGPFYQSVSNQRINEVICYDSKSGTNMTDNLDDDFVPKTSDGSGGDGYTGGFPTGGGGGNDDGGSEDGGAEHDDEDKNEFGPIMKFEEVMKEAETRGATLPMDMLEAAKITGLRRLILTRYLDLQVKCNLLIAF